MKRRIFRRTFVIYGAVLILSVVFINYYLTRIVKNTYIDQVKSSLSVQTDLLMGITPFTPPERTMAFCRDIRGKAKARVTLVGPDGIVLCDSDKDASIMENHGDRPEIQQALLSSLGTSVRFSTTAQNDYLYVARKVQKNGMLQGFLRLSIPLTEVNTSLFSLRLRINLAVIFVFLVVGIILIVQTERIRKFVIRISEHAGALSHGLLKKRLFLEGAGEFTELAHNLNSMAEELEQSTQLQDEEKKRLNVILKSIPDALLLINIRGLIKLSNNAARELFASDHIEYRSYLEVVRNPEFVSLVEQVMKDRMPGSTDMTLDIPEEKHLLVRVLPLYYEVGTLAGVVAVFHDTTQMKKLEQMRKDFVANVSHEIKTPVTAIQGFAETLLDGAIHDRENAEKFLQTIASHSMRLNRLVEDLLTISKVELGVIAIRKTDVSLTESIDTVINMLLVPAAEKELLLRNAVNHGDIVIHADKDKLEQILLNLLDNAIKFTEQGEIEVGASHEKGRAFLYVKDTGAGIPPEYLPRLGERFFRVDASRSRELGGTGLGLAIVKHLVKAHGWEMKVASVQGKGTTVKIYYA